MPARRTPRPRRRGGEHPFVVALEQRLFNPPGPDECGVDRAELAALVRAGEVVRLDGGVIVAAAAIPAAASCLAVLLVAQPDGVTASAVREALGTSRKFALPLLAHLDAVGATRRRGDLRIAGPRLQELAAEEATIR